MKYTKIAPDAFEQLQINAGIVVDDFTPATGEIGNIEWATSGGLNFVAAPTFTDYGEDIDNVPSNMMELKKQTDVAVTLSGTALTVTSSKAKRLAGAADIDPLDETHIIPRKDLKLSDFEDVWFIGDYSDVNTGSGAGFIAIHLMNTLSTDGFQLQTNDDGKGNFAFTLTGHFSMDAQDTVPYEIYIKQGTDSSTLRLMLDVNKMYIEPDQSSYAINILNYSSFTDISVASSDATIVDDANITYSTGVITFSTETSATTHGAKCTLTVSGKNSGKTYNAQCVLEVYNPS